MRILLSLLLCLFGSSAWANPYLTLMSGSVAAEPPACSTEATSCVTDDSAAEQLLGYDSGYKYLASKFTMPATGRTICKIALRGKKNNSPTFTFTAAIYTDNSGSPGTIVGTASDAFDSSTLGSSNDWFSLTGLSAELSGSTDYWIVLNTSAQSSTNYVRVISDTGCDVDEGIERSADGSTWFSVTTGAGLKFYLYY